MVTARQPIGRALRHRFLSILVGQAQGPQTLYLGLTTSVPAPDMNMEQVELMELEAPGYQRLEAPPGAWDISSTPVEARAEIAFRNGSQESVWRGVNGAFLTTSRGSDGLLVAAVPLRHGRRDLFPGDTIVLPITINYD